MLRGPSENEPAEGWGTGLWDNSCCRLLCALYLLLSVPLSAVDAGCDLGPPSLGATLKVTSGIHL